MSTHPFRAAARGLRNLAPSVLAIALLAVALPAGPAAAADDAYKVFSSDEGRRLSFASCGGEDESWGECVSYGLFCDDLGVEMSITGTGEKGRDTRTLAGSLIREPWGEAKVSVVLGGKVKATMPVASVAVSLDEMNADWDVTIRSFDPTALLAALNAKSARGARLTVAGQTFELTPQHGDDATLMAFKKACDRR